MKWIDQIEVANRTVFLRVDHNVPIQNGRIQDTTRIRESLPSIRWITEHGGRVVLASHLGRPDGSFDPRYSLKLVAEELEQILGRTVIFLPDYLGPTAREKLGESAGRDAVFYLENLRFHKGEEENDPEFSKALASLAEVYVNDAFGTAHRAHASTVGVPKYLNEKAGGFLLKKEVEALEKVLSHPERPLIAVLGGAKVSEKIEVLENLALQADRMLVGGGMALTLLSARGFPTGGSRIESEKLPMAREFLKGVEEKKRSLLLPEDHVVVPGLDRKADATEVGARDVPPGWLAVDIGSKTIRAFENAILSARTVVWNGPMGMFEVEEFSRGTKAVARAVARVEGMTLVGGGDTVSALASSGCLGRVKHISTGGGATLDFLAGKKLPGIEALRS